VAIDRDKIGNFSYGRNDVENPTRMDHRNIFGKKEYWEFED